MSLRREPCRGARPRSRRWITRMHGAPKCAARVVLHAIQHCTATHHGGTTPRSNSSPVSRVEHGNARVEDRAGSPSTAPSPTRAPVDHHAATADHAVVLDDHRRGLRRFEHAADAHAAGQVHVLADLRARSDRRPGVDHRAAADPRADVDVARHEDHARIRGSSPTAPSRRGQPAHRPPRSWS